VENVRDARKAGADILVVGRATTAIKKITIFSRNTKNGRLKG